MVIESLMGGNYEDQWILWKCPPDELHLFLGTGNKLFDSIHKCMIEDIETSFHQENVYVWAHKLGIVGQKYRGRALDGPNLRNYQMT